MYKEGRRPHPRIYVHITLRWICQTLCMSFGTRDICLFGSQFALLRNQFYDYRVDLFITALLINSFCIYKFEFFDKKRKI